jgi:hypothetical protein
MNSRRFIALTETQMIMASIPGQGRAPQQQQPAHVRYGSVAAKAIEALRPWMSASLRSGQVGRHCARST